MKRSEAIFLIEEVLFAYIGDEQQSHEAADLVMYILEEAGIQAPDDVCQIIHEWEKE